MDEKKLTGYPSIDKPWLKYYSEEAINASLPECTIYEYLWKNNKDHLDDIALNYFDRKISYGELFKNIEKAAKAFSALGVKQGDIVVMATVTTPETIYAFYGLNRLGAISNMVDPRTSTEGIKEYISEVGAKLVLTIDAALPKIEKAVVGTKTDTILVVSPADSLPQPKKVLYLLSNKLKGKTPKLSDKCISWSEFIKKGFDKTPAYSEYKKDTCCVIVHTGGTTGTPKGVMLSNDNANAGCFQIYHTPITMQRRDIFLNIMPPFIAYGIILGIHTALCCGWKSVIIPKFEQKQFDKMLLNLKPNGLIGVPAYYDILIKSKRLKDNDLSFVKVLLAGGDKTPEEFEEQINSFLSSHNANIHLSKGYSLTEASATATASFESTVKIGSSGIPLVKTTISAFKEEIDYELPYGEIGEICVNSPTIMLGYFNDSLASNAIIKKHGDGSFWIHTGDIGFVDKNGYVFIKGRLKRIIVRHDGFKVFPSQIENAISKSQSVNGCCTVGIADKNHSQGQLPIVFVVKSGNESENAMKAELFELCKKELPEYAQPIDFVFIDALPLTPIGKIDYRALEKQAEEMSKT